MRLRPAERRRAGAGRRGRVPRMRDQRHGVGRGAVWYPPRVAAPQPARADYGQDAPGVVRNLIVVAAVGLALWATTVAGLWTGVIKIGPVALQLAPMGLITAVICSGLA